MTPRHPLAHHRPHAPGRRARTIALLVVLACGATRAAGTERAAADTLSAPTGTGLSTARRPFEGALRADRLAHASFAIAIGTGVGLSSREPAAGAGTVIALAVAKELLDDRFDRGDLVAGTVGAGLAWLIVAALTR